jgi:GTP-binding protein
MSSCLTGYALWAGDITGRARGAMVKHGNRDATSYQLENLQERGTLFLSSTDPVYNGMIVGEHCRPGDLPCNPTKKKHVTNHRSSTQDMAVKLDVPLKMTLERALEWIEDDELVEVTPRSIRLRKAILDYEERRKSSRKTA